MELDKNKIIKNATDFLGDNLKQLSSVKLNEVQIIELKSSDFKEKKGVFKCLENIKKNTSPLLYTIEFTSSIRVKNTLLESFRDFQQKNKNVKRGEGRINTSRFNENHEKSVVLYVGSCSKTNFSNRLKAHLGGTNSVRTYALYLNKWDNKIDYCLRICTYEILTKKKAISQFLVELIEQQFWDELKPIFGKRSGQ